MTAKPLSDGSSPWGKAQAPHEMQVWDLPVRLVHWALVSLVAFSWVSARLGWFVSHTYSGYAILCLLLFRIYWGFLGGEHARFASFIRGPVTVVRYVLGRHPAPAFVGHNPLGGWNVVALLVLLTSLVSLGLFAIGADGLEFGPLSKHVSFPTGRLLERLHATLFNVLLLFITLHITAVLVYWCVKRDNLIASMITGTKRVRLTDARQIRAVSRRRALLGLATAILIVLLLSWAGTL